jgi:hypothetical protein
MPSSLASGLMSKSPGACSSDRRCRHDRRARLEREAHEAGAEALEAVALAVRLVHAAHAFGEHHHALFRVDQRAEILGRADQVAATRRHLAHEGQARDPVLAEPAREPRRLSNSMRRRASRRRTAAGPRGGDQDTALGHVLEGARPARK